MCTFLRRRVSGRAAPAAALGFVCLVSAAHAQEPAAAGTAAPVADAAADLRQLKADLARLKQTVADQAALLESSMATQVESELGALSAGAVDQRPSSVSVYGFMDMGLQRVISDNRLVRGVGPSTGTTFVSGNNNVYFDARPLHGWRALLEVRFALHPHGNVTFASVGPAKREDSSILDSTSASGRNIVRLGSIIIERSVMEWQYDSRLTIQMGYFLTPWGIWNIDHGTPTLISLLMPTFLLNEAVLRQQIGVHAFGSFALGDFNLGYGAYVSNGRSTSQFDLDDDKAVGGRLTLSRFGAVKTTLGSSFFHGSSEDDLRTLRVVDNAFDIEVQQTVARNETTAGLDLSIDWKGLRVRAEAVARRVTFAPGKYPAVFINPLATEPNRTELYAYGLVAYRRAGIEPFVYAEHIDAHKRTDLIDKGYGLSAGLNLYLSTVSQIKLQYVNSVFDSVYGPGIRTGFITSRYVLSF